MVVFSPEQKLGYSKRNVIYLWGRVVRVVIGFLLAIIKQLGLSIFFLQADLKVRTSFQLTGIELDRLVLYTQDRRDISERQD